MIIIAVPPSPVCEQMEAFRRPINDQVGSVEALRYPPHLTLRTGLVCPDTQADRVAQEFLEYAGQFSEVEVATAGLFFTTYGQPLRGMVGWSVPLTASLLQLHEGLLGFKEFIKGPQGPFQPHVSVCYGDLSPVSLAKVKSSLSHASVPDWTWTLDHVALYTEQPKGWVEWSRVWLKSSLRP